MVQEFTSQPGAVLHRRRRYLTHPLIVYDYRYAQPVSWVDAPGETAPRGLPRHPCGPEGVAWMFPLMGHDDRENMTRVWQMLMPAEAFAGVKQLVQKAVGDDWAELTRRIPELAG